MQVKTIPKKKESTFGYNVDSKTQTKWRSYQRKMRKNPTFAENRFFSILLDYFRLPSKYKTPKYRNRKCVKQHVIRQKMFWFKITDGYKAYIVDFWLPKYRIAFEIDGRTHDSQYAKAKDYIRSSFIEKKNVKIVRIKNEDTKNKDKCLEIIQNAINGIILPENKTKSPPLVKISRQNEIEMQKKFIENHGVTRCKSSNTESK